MNIRIRGKRANFIFSIVLVLFLSSIVLNHQNHQYENDLIDDQSKNDQFSDPLYDETLKTSANDPNGKPLLVNQFANITKSFDDVESNENITFALSPGWISKNTTIHYEGVEREKQWNTNDHFTYNDDNWDFAEKDTSGIFWDGGYVDWDIGGHVGTNYFGMSAGNLIEGDYVGFQQNYTISGESLSNNLAIASFDYFFDDKGSYPNASMYLEISINGVRKNISRQIDDITFKQWETLSVQYNPTSFGQILPGNISVFAGVYMDKNSIHAQTDEVFLDNIKLTLWTNLNNTPGLIQTYDVMTDINHQYHNLSIGNGYTFIDVERTSPGDITFTIFENISSTMDFLDFKINQVTIVSPSIKTFNTTYSGKDGSFYVLGSSITWKASFSVSLPTYYISWIEIQKPFDWSINSILDGFDTERIGETFGKEYGSSLLSIPSNILGEGTWDIEAVSLNLIQNFNVMVWNNSQFENQSTLTNNDIFRINLSLNNTISLQNSEANCTILFPNGTVFLRESVEPSSYNINFGNYTVGKNMTIGQYSVELTWRNNKSLLELDQVGFAEFEFTIWHHTNLTAITSYFEVVSGDPILLKVAYFDIDINNDIDFAQISFTTSYGHSGTLSYQGLGLYFVDLDTSSLELGNYFISFNASKIFYENQTKLNLIQFKIITQPLALDFPTRVINSTGNNHITCKVNVVGEISGTPIGSANISSDWDNGYSILNYGNGTFDFNFSTYGLPVHGILDTFDIEIFANKTNFGSTSDFITLIIHPIPTIAIVNETNIQTYVNEDFDVKINYIVEKTGDFISGGICEVIWEGEYNVSQISDGFIINYKTTGLNIDPYNSFIRIYKPGYEDALLKIPIIINPIEISVSTIDFTDSINAYSGESISIILNLTEFGSNKLIENATIYCYWEFGTYYFEEISNGLYQLNFEITSNIMGTHRFNLVITTEEYIYKTTEHSFLIIITEPEIPDYVGWIILIGLIIIIGILGSLSLRSYIIIPRRKKREIIISDKTQPYKDIRNIQAVLVSNRYSGIALYNKTFSILDENYISGFSGFIQAITILGKQYTKDGVKVVNIESNAEDTDEKEKEIKELDFNFFHSLICDYGDLRVVLLLTKRSSERLRRKIDIITKEIFSQNRDLISSFNGQLSVLKTSIEEVLYRHLPLYYKNPFELNKSKHYHSAKLSGFLTNLEIRMLNILESQSKFKKYFFLDDAISLLEDISENEKIIALESLIEHKMIKPEES